MATIRRLTAALAMVLLSLPTLAASTLDDLTYRQAADGAQQAAPPQAEPAGAQPAAAPVSREPRIEEIDFRRGGDGAGRLIVTFDRSGVDSRVRESGSRVIAELRRVALPAELDQVLDVTDFGTPLRRISPQPGSDGVTLELEASGDYAMLSIHSGRQLVIEIQPLSQAERVTRERERLAYTGERITLNFQDIEVRSVLAIIADFTGLNLVASDSVTGNVTLNLEDVPWDQALDLVLKSHGLASRQEGNVIVVAPASELANIERQELESREQLETLSPLTTEMLQVRYARASDLAALLRGEGGFGLLTERGRVSVDQRTNTLLIQDTAGQIQSILRTLDQLDVAVRQVQIEARIVIARDSATRELGVRWGLSQRQGVVFDDSGIGSVVDRNPGGASRASAGLAVDMGSATNPSTTFAFGYLSGDILLDLELRALESEGKSQTISQPRVITANRRTAVIKQGTEIPYQEATSSGATSTEFKEAVLSLEVTPQITPDNRIIMDLVINNDTVSEQSFEGAPAINTNQIETQVLVNNGETVVLGGILTTEQIRSLFKTPFFGDLPLIGNLFRYTQDSSEKVELLVFITPRIIEDGLAIR
ncbi:type IV pilus secretin PilQ [Halomonas salipaludis]|uniref:Type II and III secretion system protein n=1 Tax=Halomonas salipaludis TaxID=2032625 RepID=A0A2A2EUF9_9GAMM|nr:type IV pilus secretin PilQ family protein [Halomonas salipaludis]PAU75987.1 type II and III secretion system protein [Halomonas salipaludis]